MVKKDPPAEQAGGIRITDEPGAIEILAEHAFIVPGKLVKETDKQYRYEIDGKEILIVIGEKTDLELNGDKGIMYRGEDHQDRHKPDPG